MMLVLRDMRLSFEIHILVLDAPLALVVDEATTAASAPLAAKVRLLGVAAGLGLANAAADTEQDGRDEEACEGAPGEAVSVGTNASLLAGRAEVVAADDGPGTVEMLESCGRHVRTDLNIRHERCSESLEEKGNGCVKTGKVGTETEAQGESAGEEGDDGEEQGDDVEGKHEPAQVEELVGADELFGNVVFGAEVARRVEGQSSLSVTAESILAAVCATESEESPAGRVAELLATRDAIGGGLQEIGVSHWGRVDCSGEDDEELEHDATGKDDQCDQAEDRTWRRLLDRRIVCASMDSGLRVMAITAVLWWRVLARR